MAQTFSQFATSEYLQDAPAKLNNNFSAVASQFAGTAFPETNLVEGMVCYRTDLDKVYRYVNEEWVEEANLKDNTRCVEFIKGTQTSSTGSWKGVTQDSSLYDGKSIFYYLPKAGSGNATLNLTFPNGTTTGAKAVRMTGTTQATTHYAAGSVISLTYVQSENAWCRADYNSNTTYSAMSQSEATTGTSTTARTITAKVLSTTIANKVVAIANTITDEQIEELWAVAVTITQSANQTITVTANGVANTTSFTAQPGDTWTATVAANDPAVHVPGTLSKASGVLADDIAISATPVTVRIYNGASIVVGLIDFGDAETFGYIDPVNDDPYSSMTHSVEDCEIYRDDETSQPVIISAFNSETGDGITLSVGSGDAGWFQQFGGYVNVFQYGLGGTVEQHIVQNLTMNSTSVNHVDNKHINIVTQNQFEYGSRYGIVFSGDTLTDEQLVNWYKEHGL